MIDLHTHSRASDGATSPADLVALARWRGVTVLALTDHDTTAGIPAARAAAGVASDPSPLAGEGRVRGTPPTEQSPVSQAAAPSSPSPLPLSRQGRGVPSGLRLIPGVEISARYGELSAHILGLGIDPDHAGFQQTLSDLRQRRRQRNPLMIEKLRGLGMDVSMAELAEVAGVADPAADDAVISRAHIAQLLVRKGYVANTQQAFARFVGASGPAYVEKDRLSVAEACSAIRAAGGVAVLAHAVQLRCPNFGVMERVVQEMTAAGLDGIEVYHPDHDAVMTRQCLDMARRLGLLLAGGSDFHGSPKQIDRLGTPRVPRAAVEPLMERLGVA